MHVALKFFPFLADNQNDFCVCLQPEDSIDHMNTGPFQLFGPLNVVVFVKAGFEFHQCHHLFAVFSGADQGCNDRRIF